MDGARKTYFLRMGGTDIEVTRKDIKALRMRLASDGTIKLSAPLAASASHIESFVIQNEAWILRAQKKAAALHAIAHVHDGGRFMLWGNPCTIRVEAAAKRPAAPSVSGGELIVPLQPENHTAEGFQKACAAFLASEVRRMLDEGVIARMEALTEASASTWRVRSMGSRWGSCQVAKRSITINAQLAHYDRRCLGYVVCHELCHLHEPSHNARFHALMDHFYPDWKSIRKLLEAPAFV